MVQFKSLRTFNIFLGLLHAGSAVYIYSNRDKVSKFFTEVDIYENVLSPSLEPGSSSGFVTKNIQKWNVIDLIVAFFGITALFHFFYAFNPAGYYESAIDEKSNPLRWIEYSITATIMIVIMALSATVQNLQVLKDLVTITVVIMLLGMVIEKLTRDGSYELAKVVTVLAWLLQIHVFMTIGTRFVSTIKSVNKKIEEDSGLEGIPDFVYAILVSQLVFYSSFGIIQGVYLWKSSTNKEVQYINYENAYHVLSLIAKLSLGWMFYFGATQSRTPEEKE